MSETDAADPNPLAPLPKPASDEVDCSPTFAHVPLGPGEEAGPFQCRDSLRKRGRSWSQVGRPGAALKPGPLTIGRTRSQVGRFRTRPAAGLTNTQTSVGFMVNSEAVRMHSAEEVPRGLRTIVMRSQGESRL